MAVAALLAGIVVPGIGWAAPLEDSKAPAAAVSSAGESRVAELPQTASVRPGIASGGSALERSQSEAANAAFRLSSAELLHVRVRGQPEFTGDYRINPDMTISMARLGRVAVGSMAVLDLERYLSERLSSSLRQDVSVSVEVVRFRPFFMTGQVASPGSVEWRPDLTLIQAISLSGGVARPTVSNTLETPESRLLVEQARVRHSFAVAQLARFNAEKLRKETLDTDQLLRGYVAKAMPESREALEAFLTRQNQLLDEQRAAHVSRIESMSRERDAILHELEAAKLQSEEVKQQVELAEMQMQSVEQLKAQQLVTNARYIEMRRALSEIKVRHSESISLLQRSRSRYMGLEREIQTVQLEREALLNERIETLEREVSELELTLGEAGLLEVSGGVAMTPSLIYHIARKTSTGMHTIVANLFTEILPGDVVIVSSRQRPKFMMSDGVTTMTSAPSALDEMQQIMESAVATGGVRAVSGTLPVAPGAATRRAAAHNRLGPSPRPAARGLLDGTLSPQMR